MKFHLASLTEVEGTREGALNRTYQQPHLPATAPTSNRTYQQKTAATGCNHFGCEGDALDSPNYSTFPISRIGSMDISQFGLDKSR